MSVTGAIFVTIGILFLVGIFIFRPLFQSSLNPSAIPSKRKQWMAEKEALLDQIQALEFDAETGKVSAEELQAKRPVLVVQAANLLRQLDGISDSKEAAEEIEAFIAQFRTR